MKTIICPTNESLIAHYSVNSQDVVFVYHETEGYLDELATTLTHLNDLFSIALDASVTDEEVVDIGGVENVITCEFVRIIVGTITKERHVESARKTNALSWFHQHVMKPHEESLRKASGQFDEDDQRLPIVG